MDNTFCFQCEQTAGYTGCTGKIGICGKKESTALSGKELSAFPTQYSR